MASSNTKISLTKASSKDIDRGLKLRSLTRKQELEHKEMGMKKNRTPHFS